MTPTRNRVLLIIGSVFVIVAMLGFGIRVTGKVAAGNWLEPYLSWTFVPWNYGSAFVLLTVMLLGLLVGGIARFVGWLAKRRQRER